MNRKRLLFGSIGLTVATAVGISAVALTSSGSSLVSSTVPTSKVVSANVATSAPVPHRRVGPRARAVYSETIVPVRGGGYKTIIQVRGALHAISSSSISVIRQDTGATITVAITPTTSFVNTTDSALVSDLSSKKAVTVRLVETSNNAVSVSVPPPPGTRPKPGPGQFRGTFPPRNGTTPVPPASA